MSFWIIFCPLTPPPSNLPTPSLNSLENQNFEKTKKMPEDIIILQRCTINDNHMMYGSWDIECKVYFFFHFWPFFALLPFYPPFLPPLPNSPKNKILKKMKKNSGKHYRFTLVYNKWQSYETWFLRYQVWQTFFVILDHFLPLYPITTQKIKSLKKWKNPWRYYHFPHVYHKWQSYDVWFVRYGAWQNEFFVILDHFSLFYPPPLPLWTQKIEISEKWTTHLKVLLFYKCVP